MKTQTERESQIGSSWNASFSVAEVLSEVLIIVLYLSQDPNDIIVTVCDDNFIVSLGDNISLHV